MLLPPCKAESYAASNPWLVTEASDLNLMYIDFCVDWSLGGISTPQKVPSRGELDVEPSLTWKTEQA